MVRNGVYQNENERIRDSSVSRNDRTVLVKARCSGVEIHMSFIFLLLDILFSEIACKSERLARVILRVSFCHDPQFDSRAHKIYFWAVFQWNMLGIYAAYIVILFPQITLIQN